jgi:hypothetical protein
VTIFRSARSQTRRGAKLNKMYGAAEKVKRKHRAKKAAANGFRRRSRN